MVRRFIVGLLVVFTAGATVGVTAEQGSRARDKRVLKDLAKKSPYFYDHIMGTTKRYGSGYTEGAPATISQAAGAPSATMAADGEAILPAGWGRKLEGTPTRTYTVIVNGDTATVDVVSQVDATLYVDTTFDGIKNPGAKPIEDTITRHSTWQKEDDKWKIQEVTVGEANLRDPGRQTVHVTEVRVWVNGELKLDVTNPLQKYDVDTGIVHVRNGDAVTVEAAVVNTSNTGLTPQTYVYCHPNRPEGGRDLMYDDGTHGDAVADDGTWTYQYTVNLRTGVHFAGIDALDSLCLQNETEDDYNAAGWGMPYVVDE